MSLYPSTISPASRSTKDIWPNIFAFALEGNDTRTIDNITPLRSVCRSWNTMAITTPELWTFIDVEIRRSKMSPPLSIVAAQLQRAKALPLTIRVRQVDQQTWKRHKAKKLMTLLMQYALQWNNVELDLRGQALQFITNTPTPALDSLAISTAELTENDRLWALINNASSLRNLSLSGVVFQSSKFVDKETLTAVSLDQIPSVQDLLNILASCTSLVEGTFGLIENASTILEDDFALITHRSLQSVSLIIREGELRLILEHTSFPSLKHLSIRAPWPRDQLDFWPQEELITFFETSSCTLETWEVFGMGINGEEMCLLLQHPAVCRLQTLRANMVCEWGRPNSVSVEDLRKSTEARVVVDCTFS